MQILLLFAALAVILRFFSFFPSVIDHDESTYLEMARQLLQGKILYVDMIDIKPPGIFLILGGFQAVFGYSIFVMRMLVSIWIGLTAFMIFLTCMLLIRDKRASFAGGIIYIFLISTWSFYGLSITPEIFFNLFTISALYIILKMKSGWRFLLAGLVAGFGFIVKYFVLLDFAVFLLFFLFLDKKIPRSPIPVLRIVAYLVLAGIGFFLPFGLVNLYYFTGSHWDAFVNIIYLSPQRYPSPIHPVRMPLFILDFQLRFFPVFIFYYFALFDRSLKVGGIGKIKTLLVLWSLAALLAVVISGNHYGHYTIQLMLPVSILAGLFFHSERVLPAYFKWMAAPTTGVILLSSLILLITALKLEYIVRHDTPREVAGYLKPRLKEGDVIYTANYHHILYYLLKKDSPTPYIHRSLLLDDRHFKALNIDQEAEFRKIISKNPAFIITKADYPQNVMKDYLLAHYEVEKEFGDIARLWRRRE